MSSDQAREELADRVTFSDAEPITFSSAAYGVICTGEGGCGAMIATSEQVRHRRWHRTLADAIPQPRGDGGG